MPNLEGLLGRERAALDTRLATVAAELRADAGVLAEPMAYALTGGGKRLRGTLSLLAFRAVGGTATPAVYDVAAAVELAHTYSLVHDDLPCMDDDDLRRGRPTLHRVFGSALAAAAGVALIPLAFRVLVRGARELRLDADYTARLAITLARGIGAGGMVGGQWLDLEAEGRGDRLALTEITRIHAAKTGALFESALVLGGTAARGAPDAVAALAGFGAALGLAFQVVDDLLDETASSAELGKTAGKDARQAKATYPALLGRDGAWEHARVAMDQARARLAATNLASAELAAVADWVLARHH